MIVPQSAGSCFWAERPPGESWVVPPLRPQRFDQWICLRRVPPSYVTDADCVECPQWMPRGIAQDRPE